MLNEDAVFRGLGGVKGTHKEDEGPREGTSNSRPEEEMVSVGSAGATGNEPPLQAL